MKLNPEELLRLADRVVTELLEMHEDTGINLDAGVPACLELVQTLRCAARSDPAKTSGVSYICVLPPGHFHPERGDKHGTTIRFHKTDGDVEIINGEWT